MSNLKIGNLELDSQVILAPMAGVTNSAFKEVVRELGAGLVCTEMINDKALLHGNENTRKMVNISSLERPVSVQIFSNEVDTLIKAAQEIDQLENVDIIDINMGCPAPKITKNNSGSKILLYPELLYDMIKGVVDHVNKPVTVKMRIGWDEEHINVIENAKLAEKAGASAIIVHGRTTKQQYMGKANWDIIKEVKKVVNIPVIGNGDIDSPIKAKAMLDYSGVDGIMIGRAAMGNPWIIKQIDHYLKTGELLEEPTIKEKLEMIKHHAHKLIDLKGENVAIKEMRGHASWYLKGIKGVNKFKTQLQTCNTYNDLEKVLKDIDAFYTKECYE